MLKKISIVVAAGLGIAVLSGVAYYNLHPTFGVEPSGARLGKIKQSVNYKDGFFHNIEPTETLTTDKSSIELFWDNLVKPKADNIVPHSDIPVIKTDLKNIDINKNVIVWLGHSSYYVQLDGRRILIDPILNSNASPLPIGNSVFKGTDVYRADDMPDIDYLLITHDHYDHLDYKTFKELKDKVKSVVVPLGLGDTIVSWGYISERVIDLDWYESLQSIDDSFNITFTPARHYSSRKFTRFKNLWGSYVIQGTEKKLYFGGDSGYGKHFKDIGNRYGSFDFVALDSGQYNEKWANIHMRPEQTVQAASDLNAKILIPAHIGRFSLAQHDWKEPFKLLVADSSEQDFSLLMGKIGEVIDIDKPDIKVDEWWNNIE